MSATSAERAKRRWRATRSRWRTGTSTLSTISASCEAKAMSAEVTYKTHILIGVRANGVKTVIAAWPLVPKQAEVLHEIKQAGNGYTTFALCTPTSIIPVESNGGGRRDSWRGL